MNKENICRATEQDCQNCKVSGIDRACRKHDATDRECPIDNIRITKENCKNKKMDNNKDLLQEPETTQTKRDKTKRGGASERQ